MVWRLPVLLSKFFISLISFHHHFSSSFPAVLSFHILLLNTLPTQQLLITHVSFTYMPTEVCLNDYYLTPRNTPYLVIQIIAKIIFLFQLTRCEAYALTTFSNTSLVSSYKVLLCLKTSSSPQHYSHTFLFKITPTPLLSTPLFNNLNPVYLVCWSQHLLDTLTDIVPILTYRSLLSSLLLPANTSSTISSSFCLWPIIAQFVGSLIF